MIATGAAVIGVGLQVGAILAVAKDFPGGASADAVLTPNRSNAATGTTGAAVVGVGLQIIAIGAALSSSRRAIPGARPIPAKPGPGTLVAACPTVIFVVISVCAHTIAYRPRRRRAWLTRPVTAAQGVFPAHVATGAAVIVVYLQVHTPVVATNCAEQASYADTGSEKAVLAPGTHISTSAAVSIIALQVGTRATAIGFAEIAAYP